MPFDWLEFFTLAQELALRGDEASKRTAISRAYYFVFHLAYVRAVRNCGPKPSGPPPTHAWCWEKFINTADAGCAALGVEGDRLKQLRHRVDYKNGTIQRLDEVCQRMIMDVQHFHADFVALNARFPTP